MTRHPVTGRATRRTVLGAAVSGAVGVLWPAAARAADRPGTNIRVSRDAYPEHAEPSIAVNPRDPGNLLGACMSWYPGTSELITTYASFDGGATWRSNGALSLPAANIAFADDVTVAFDRAGRGYVCAMAPLSADREDRACYVWRTADGGRTFADPAPVTLREFVDHPSLAIAADRPYLHVFWVADEHAALGYTRSLDGGTSFEPSRAFAVPDGTAVNGPAAAAGPDGLVAGIYGYADQSQPQDPDALPGGGPAPQNDTDMAVRVVCSTDGGRSFADPVDLGTTAFTVALAGDVRAGSSPAIAAAPHHRALYAAYTTHEAGADHSDVVVRASFDGGANWTDPVTATPPDHRVYFQPQLAVDPVGRVALSAFALSGGLVETVLFTSPLGVPRFGAPRTVTDRPFDPTLGGPGGKHGAWWIGDYQGLAATATRIHLLWNDTRTGALELFTAAHRWPDTGRTG